MPWGIPSPPSVGRARLIGRIVPVYGCGMAVEVAIIIQRVPVAGVELNQGFRMVAEVVVVDGIHLQ